MIHLLLLFAFYMLPTLIASGRHLPERGAIAMVNFLLGWTVVGWFATLVWAITAPAPWQYYPHPPCPPYYR